MNPDPIPLDSHEFQRALLQIIGRVQNDFIAEGDARRSFEELLKLALDLTGSEYGFIGEVLRDGKGQPYLKTFAVTNISWDQSTRELYATHALKGLEFRNVDTLFGRVMTTEKAVVSNCPSQDPRRGGLPAGHPELRAFLGLPLIQGSLLVGMIGIANRPGGYDESYERALSPFLSTCATLIVSCRRERLRAEAESARREAELRFQSVMDTIEEVVWVGRPGSLEPTFLSSAFEKVWGRSFEEFRVRPEKLLETIHPDDRGLFLETLRHQSEGATTSLYYRILRPDGAERWIWDRGFPVVGDDGLVVAVNGIASDVTERREAEQRMQESEERLRAIFEQMPDSVFLVDMEDPKVPSKVIYANGEAARAHGMEVMEMIGRSVCDLDAMSSGDKFHERHQQLKEGACLRFEGLHRRSDGSTFPVEIIAKALPSLGHGVVLAIDRDLTERKAAEKIRSDLEARLRVAQKLEAIGTLAGGVAHDFNNILGVILGNAELARGDLGNPEALADSLDEILKASRRGKALVQQILTFSQQRTPEQRLLRLESVIEEAMRTLRVTLPAGVQLSSTIHGTIPPIHGDAIQVHQALVNLCTNASQAMESNGLIEIVLEALDSGSHGSFAHPTPAHGPYVRLSILDSGPGIPAESLERIFEPFYTTKPSGQGTGLGLSVVHGIMQSHAGSVVAENRPQGGAAFHLYFPAASNRVESPEASSAPEIASAGRLESLVIVDDEASVLLAMQRILERQGYRVHAFAQPAQALEVLSNPEFRCDALISDYNMPGLNGLLLLQAAVRDRPSLPTVLTTGFITEELRRSAHSSGVRNILLKPFTREELTAVVGRLLVPENQGRAGEKRPVDAGEARLARSAVSGDAAAYSTRSTR